MKLCLITILILCGCNASKQEAPSPTPTQVPSNDPIAVDQPVEKTAEEKHTSALIEQLANAKSLQAAIEVTKPQMKHEHDNLSEGARFLTLWAADHAQLKNFVVQKNETSSALIKKDEDDARGKRMCVGGSVIQIAKANREPVIYDGLLMNDSGNLFKFIAVGSTGKLLEHSAARFCGVVTGVYSYQTQGNQFRDAVRMVGMFDIPENKSK